VNGIVRTAGSTAEVAFKDLLLVFSIYVEGEIPLADRAAEDIHE
jgi:hypothetical protein